MSQIAIEPSEEPADSPAPRRQSPGFFSTEHLNSDLKGRSVRAGAATVATQAATFLLKLGSVPIMARLLTPSDFGLVAMVAVVTGFVLMFKEAGLDTATIQRAEINHGQVSTLFWINVALSLALMAVLICLAPAVAWFYGEPRLVWITLASAATIPLGGVCIQHQALMRRQLRFGTIGIIAVTAHTLGVVVGISTAALGAGYWAIIAWDAVSLAATAAMLWGMCPWRPGLPRRNTGVRPMLALGGNLTMSSFLMYVRRNLDTLLVGAAWGPTALGVYVKAYQLLVVPMREINAPMTVVTRPVLSRLQDQPNRFRRYYGAALEIIVLCGMPIAAFAFAASHNVIVVVLGEQWTDCIPVFRALAPAMFVSTFNVAAGWVFVALGRTREMLKADILMTSVVVCAFLVGLSWGPVGVAAAFSISYSVTFPFVIAYAYKNSPVRLHDFGAILWRPSFASTVGVATLFLLPSTSDIGSTPFFSLVIQAAVFTAAYLGAFAALPGSYACLQRMIEIWRAFRFSA